MLTIGVQMIGLILILWAMRKDEDVSSIDRRVLTAIPSDIILIPWGIFVPLFGILAYGMEQPGLNGTLTIWNQLLNITFIIEGLLWIISGIVFNAIIRALKPQDF